MTLSIRTICFTVCFTLKKSLLSTGVLLHLYVNYNFSFQTFKDIKDYKISEIGNTINITLNKMDKEWYLRLISELRYVLTIMDKKVDK